MHSRIPSAYQSYSDSSRLFTRPVLTRGWTVLTRGWTVLTRGWTILTRGSTVLTDGSFHCHSQSSCQWNDQPIPNRNMTSFRYAQPVSFPITIPLRPPKTGTKVAFRRFSFLS